MNLRLDRNSIRVRVDHDEALALSRAGVLSETLPFGSKSLEMRIESKGQEKLQLDSPFTESGLKLLIPETDLMRLLFNKENRGAKSSLELKETVTLGDRDIELRFEIDQLKPKQKQKGEKT